MNESLERTNMPSNNVGKKILGIHIGEKKVILRFEDEKMSISPNTYTEFKLYPGKVLTEKDIKDLNNLNEVDKYLESIKKLLAKGPRSEQEIKEKLIKKGANKTQTKLIIAKLKTYHLIDDNAYIEEIIENGEYKNHGKNKIIENLKKKGIPYESISKIEFNDKNELKKARNLIPSLEKKFAKYNYSKKREHIYSFLLRNGFDSDVAIKAIEDIKPSNPKEELDILRKEYIKVYQRYSRKYSHTDLDRKITEYLLSKGYRYADIVRVKGEKRK